MAIGSSVTGPSLGRIALLFRAQINDTFSDGDGNQGLIMPNSNQDLLVFMSSAIRDVYSDLRNVGDPELLLDNYLLIGLPALSAPDPTVQVALTYGGYFDGQQIQSDWILPSNAIKIERLWERWSGTEDNFIPMQPAPFGIPGIQQTQRMGQWEMRQNSIWMPGCLNSVDLRIRCRITFPDIIDPDGVDFDTTYVPILGSENAIAAKMLVLYAKRFAPEMLSMALSEDTRLTGKLMKEVIRQMQNTQYERSPYGEEAVGSFPNNWSAL